MEPTIVQTFSDSISGVGNDADVILVIVLAARRSDDTNERLALTPRQKEAAMNNAAATLEQIQGTTVNASSTSFVLPTPVLADGETLTLRINAALEKSAESASE